MGLNVTKRGARATPKPRLLSDRASRQRHGSEPTSGVTMDLAARLVVAGEGIGAAWSVQRGFRYQAAGTLAMLAALVLVQPDVIWWALALKASLLVLALELINSALETLVDVVHPGHDAAVKKLKDMAAAAVVVASVGVFIIGILMILHTFGLFG